MLEGTGRRSLYHLAPDHSYREGRSRFKKWGNMSVVSPTKLAGHHRGKQFSVCF